jgi:hypothetical protein|tara:strand:- start:921 stop:1133 length:213 start_codon:yes stop_codon:yes gene_type:complete
MELGANVVLYRKFWWLYGGMTKNNGPIETTLINHPNIFWGHTHPRLLHGIFIKSHSIISKLKPNNKLKEK